MQSGKFKITKDPLPKYKVYGRYVIDWDLTESHLFDNEKEAMVFARKWGRNCNIGWLVPVYVKATGRNRKMNYYEACSTFNTPVSRSHRGEVKVTDHRK